MPARGAGSFDRRVSIQEASEVVDDSGGVSKVWLTNETVWSEVTPLRGDELFQAQQFAAKSDTRFRMRWRDDFTATDTFRLVHEGRNYNIKHIAEIGRREGLEILAEGRAE